MGEGEVSMLEMARNLLLCQYGTDEEALVMGQRTKSTEKLKFKLIGRQLVHQLLCRKLKRRKEDGERLTSEKDLEPSANEKEEDASKFENSPRLRFSEVYDGNCRKSMVEIQFIPEPSSRLETKDDESGRRLPEQERKFVAREGRPARSLSLMNYRRKFSTKTLKPGERRHQSVKGRSEERRQASCPDLQEEDKEVMPGAAARVRSCDSVDDFTSQLFSDDLLRSSQEDLLSICFE
jgi:hypothetical protein